MSDVLLNPVFPQEELDKIVKQMETAIQANKNEPSAIAGNIASVLRYGSTDPYGAVTSEASLARITTDHLKQYHQTYFRPNKGYNRKSTRLNSSHVRISYAAACWQE